MVATSVASTGGVADAAAGPHSKRVCSHAATGFAACDAHVRTDANLTPLATTTYQSGYSPTQLRHAYGLTGTTGPLVAIVDAFASPNAAADLASYRTQFGLGPATLTQVNQTGGSISSVRSDVGWGQEEMLDLEMVSAVCPACPILYVGANSASFNDLAAAVNTAAARGAKVISNSLRRQRVPHRDLPGSGVQPPRCGDHRQLRRQRLRGAGACRVQHPDGRRRDLSDPERRRDPPDRDGVERCRQRLLGLHRQAVVAARPGLHPSHHLRRGGRGRPSDRCRRLRQLRQHRRRELVRVRRHQRRRAAGRRRLRAVRQHRGCPRPPSPTPRAGRCST